jgi:circadian clock protein KaiC
VLKMRGAMHHKGDVPFTIVPGEGLRVLPITAVTPPASAESSRVRSPSAPVPVSAPASTVPSAPRARVSSGVTGLDEMTRGGFFRASTTMVSGPTGAGKTMLATRFAAAGLQGGETVLVMAYEESHEQVRANGTGLGCDFATHEQQQKLSIQSFYPEVASLDDHLVELQGLIDRLHPTRVVLDGLSALERLGSPQSYRGFLLGVTSFVRTLGLATFVTATPSSLQQGSSTADQLTGLVDTIIVLRQHESGAVLRRGVHVQRMRGSHHENTVRELVIDERGITVEGLLPQE